jgi:hypothetical protein
MLINWRIAPQDPIYETLFLSGNGVLGGATKALRTVGTQAYAAVEEDVVPMQHKDSFTLLNSFWFMIASLLQQGSDLLPRHVTLRKNL